MPLDKAALFYARAAIAKKAAVPSDAAPPAAGGGGPPASEGGAMSPPPPAQGPAGGGGAMPPPTAPPIPAPTPTEGGGDLATTVQTAVNNALAQSGVGAGKGQPKTNKPDPAAMATDMFQLKKLVMHDMRSRGKEPPPDILDGPYRDPVTGMPAQAADGGSVVQGGQEQGQAGGQPPQSTIQPMEPMQSAFPQAGGKQASHGRGLPRAELSTVEHARVAAWRFQKRLKEREAAVGEQPVEGW